MCPRGQTLRQCIQLLYYGRRLLQKSVTLPWLRSLRLVRTGPRQIPPYSRSVRVDRARMVRLCTTHHRRGRRLPLPPATAYRLRYSPGTVRRDQGGRAGSGVFRREWSKATVEMDCNTDTPSIAMKWPHDERNRWTSSSLWRMGRFVFPRCFVLIRILIVSNIYVSDQRELYLQLIHLLSNICKIPTFLCKRNMSSFYLRCCSIYLCILWLQTVCILVFE